MSWESLIKQNTKQEDSANRHFKGWIAPPFFLFDFPTVSAVLTKANLFMHNLFFALTNQHPKNPQTTGAKNHKQIPKKRPSF